MPTQRLFTIPFMVARLQRPPGQLQTALSALGIEPVLLLNEVVYFDATVEDRLDQWFRQSDIERIRRGERL